VADSLTINAAAPLPEFEKRRTFETTKPGDETSTETVTQTPERATAGAQLEQAGAAETEAAKEAQVQADAAAPLKKAAAAETADIHSHQAADQDFVMRQAAEDIAKARERTQQRQAELDAMSSPSLYGNTDNHGKIVRGVAMALGGIGDAIQKAAMVRVGKAAPTIDTVGEIIDGILNQQREHISKLKDSVVMARTGEQDAREARAQMLADVDLRGASMLKRVQSLMEARLAAMGKTPEQIAADTNVAAVQGKIADKMAAHVAPLLDKITKKIEAPTVKSGGETVERVPTATKSGGPIALNDPTTGAPLATLPQGFTPEQGADTNKQLAAYKDARDALDELNGMYKEGVTLSTDQYQRRTALLNRLINSMNAVEGNKRAPSKEEVEILQKQIGGSLDTVTGAGESRLDELRKQLDRGMHMRLGGLGVNGAHILGEVNREKPAGEVAPAPKAENTSVVPTPKSAAIQLIKARPNFPGAKALRAKFHITDAELQ